VSGTPYSLQVISAGALAFNKWWSSVVAVAGGGGAIWAGVQAYFAKQNTPVQVALVAASGVLGAVALLAIALIVRADVEARTQATTAEYAARKDVATVFLNLIGSLQNGSTPTGSGGSTASPGRNTGSDQTAQTPSVTAASGIWVKAKDEGDQPFLVIGTRVHDGWRTAYLLARGDETPSWREQNEIVAWGVRPPS
jgi:hypothetical protein